MLLGKTLIGIGCFLFLLSTAFFTVSIILNHFSMQTGRTRAVVKNQKHRKNVALYMQRFYKAPPTRVGTIKHLTRGTYEYTVGQKTYTIRENFIGTPRQAPIFITVVYLKKFPGIAYISGETSLSNLRYLPVAVGALAGSAAMLICGLAVWAV